MALNRLNKSWHKCSTEPVSSRIVRDGLMKKISVSIILLILLCGGCSKKSTNTGRLQEAIVGKWWSMVNGSQKIVMEFTRDGHLKTTLAGQTTIVPYKILDESTIEINGKQKMKVTVSKDELTTTMGNESSKFLRGEGESGGKEPAPAPTPAPAPAPAGAGTITQAVLARGMSPLLHTPVEITNTFPTKGSVVVVVTVSNAPSGTRVKGVLSSVEVSKDAGNPIPPNTKLAEAQGVTQGSQNVGFAFNYSNSPVGAYKVDIYLNDKLDRTLNFIVAKDVPPFDQTPKPAVFGKCPALPRPEPTPPKFVFGVTMAQGVDGQHKPVNPGRIYPPNISAIYAVLTTENAPPNSKVAARWFANDLGGLEPCNSQINSSEMLNVGSGRPYFSVSPQQRWPEGIYRVEVYENDHLAFSTDFGVCDGSCKFQVPLSWKLP